VEFLRWTRELGYDPMEMLRDLAQEVYERKRRVRVKWES
jgi:hypothetical protein